MQKEAAQMVHTQVYSSGFEGLCYGTQNQKDFCMIEFDRNF